MTSQKLLLDAKLRYANLSRADFSTESLSDLNDHDHPGNVFERMWTPVTPDNPIWQDYRKKLAEMREDAIDLHRRVSACSKCMTVFFPCFPEKQHLHKKSASFKTAIDERRVASCFEAWIETPKEDAFYETFQYKALVGLAKEAKAWKEEDGIEYIKLVRIVKGTRPHRGRGTFGRLEFCENYCVEATPYEAAAKKFKTESLAAGIIEIIRR